MLTFKEYLAEQNVWGMMLRWFEGYYMHGKRGDSKEVEKYFEVVEDVFPTRTPSRAYRYTMIDDKDNLKGGWKGKTIQYTSPSMLTSWSQTKRGAEVFYTDVAQYHVSQYDEKMKRGKCYVLLEIKPTKKMVVGSIDSAIKWREKFLPREPPMFRQWERHEEIVLKVPPRTRVKVIDVKDCWTSLSGSIRKDL